MARRVLQAAFVVVVVALCSPAVVLAGTDCNEYGFCASCTSAGSWISHCRWCPVDNMCHATGSLYNACSTSENIKQPQDCRPDPAKVTNYDEDDSFAMLKYSKAAYEASPCSSSLLPNTFTCHSSLSYTMSGLFTTTVSAYFGFEQASNRVVIAFQGTATSSQLAEEVVEQGLAQIPGLPEGVLGLEYFVKGMVGLGSQMGNQYSLIQDLLDAHPGSSLFITGHSLGGALASMTALHMALTSLVSGATTVYTFGQPRTGNFAYAMLFNQVVKEAYRVVNSNDPVPHIPACEETCDECVYGNTCEPGYSCCSTAGAFHHGTEIWFPEGDREGKVMCRFRECRQEPFGEDPTCSNRYLTAIDKPAHSDYWDVLTSGGFCGR